MAYRAQTLLAALAISLGSGLAQSASANQLAIQTAYKDWKISQLKKGNYLADSQCNLQSVVELMKTGRRLNQGFGTAGFSYGDINRDGVEDAMVVFNPRQCDGGNALMNAQTAILILSANNGSRYVVDDKKLENIKGLPSDDMWTLFERVKSNGSIIGKAYGYRDADARCCPSRQVNFTYSYPNSKLRVN